MHLQLYQKYLKVSSEKSRQYKPYGKPFNVKSIWIRLIAKQICASPTTYQSGRVQIKSRDLSLNSISEFISHYAFLLTKLLCFSTFFQDFIAFPQSKEKQIFIKAKGGSPGGTVIFWQSILVSMISIYTACIN